MILWRVKDLPLFERIYNILKNEENIYFKTNHFQTDLKI